MRVTNVMLSLLSLPIPVLTQPWLSIRVSSLNMPVFRDLCNCCSNFLLTGWHLSDLLKPSQQIRGKRSTSSFLVWNYFKIINRKKRQKLKTIQLEEAISNLGGGCLGGSQDPFQPQWFCDCVNCEPWQCDDYVFLRNCFRNTALGITIPAQDLQ